MPLTENRTVFFKDLRVSDYECDFKNRMKPGFILRHMQEISAQHLDELELPYEKLAAQGQAFLLSKIYLEIIRRPQRGEQLTWRTTPKIPQGARFIRCNEVLDQSGAVILRADTIWTLVDMASRRILRPQTFMELLPNTGALEKSRLEHLRFRVTEEVVPWGMYTVQYADMDVNRHMNNATYVDLLCNATPPEAWEAAEPVGLYIHYQSEARLRDTLSLKRAVLSNGWYVEGHKEQGKCFETALYF